MHLHHIKAESHICYVSLDTNCPVKNIFHFTLLSRVYCWAWPLTCFPYIFSSRSYFLLKRNNKVISLEIYLVFFVQQGRSFHPLTNCHVLKNVFTRGCNTVKLVMYGLMTFLQNYIQHLTAQWATGEKYSAEKGRCHLKAAITTINSIMTYMTYVISKC